jgi:hypothetical protein
MDLFVLVAWLLLFLMLVVIFIHRVILAVKLDRFTKRQDDTSKACDGFNRGLCAMMILHTIYTVCVIALPRRSYVLFAINAPVVCRAWWLYWRGRFYYSPFQVVRDRYRQSSALFFDIPLFVIDLTITFWSRPSTDYCRR